MIVQAKIIGLRDKYEPKSTIVKHRKHTGKLLLNLKTVHAKIIVLGNFHKIKIM